MFDQLWRWWSHLILYGPFHVHHHGSVYEVPDQFYGGDGEIYVACSHCECGHARVSHFSGWLRERQGRVPGYVHLWTKPRRSYRTRGPDR